MDPGFYWWLIIISNIVFVYVPILIVLELHKKLTVWSLLQRVGIGLLVMGEMVILWNYPHIMRGWERQVVAMACIIAGMVFGWWLRERRNEDGGEFLS